jgi:hypothetical protein
VTESNRHLIQAIRSMVLLSTWIPCESSCSTPSSLLP